MPIPRSRTWLLLAGTIVLQIAIIRSATVLKRGLTAHDGSYDPGGTYKRDISIKTTLPYSEWYNSSSDHSKPFIAFAYLLLLSFLFSFIGIVASDFFCPNLSTIATYLGLSETTAGVTFLAFGNGSPDVFSTFSAMNQGTFSLAIGELIGAATFITSVVVGSIALIRPFYVPKTAFIRDVSFFTAAVIVLVVVLHDGHLTLVESTAMVALYLLYVVVVIIMNVMAKEKRHTTSRYAKTPEENGWKSLPGSGNGNGNGSGGFGAVSPITSRPESLQLPSPRFGPVKDMNMDEDRSDGSITPTGPGPRPGPRRGSNSNPNSHSHFHLDFNNLRNTPDYPETPRANFSLLGAIEFRDVVNSLKREGASRTPSPGRSPHATVERTDYFTAGHRRSLSHAPLRRSSANANPNASSSGPSRSRAISHVVQPGNMATFTMTPSDISPSKRLKLDRTKTAPTLRTKHPNSQEQEQGDEEVEELLSPVASEASTLNPWKDQHGHPPSKPVLPKLSIPEPRPFKKGRGGTPSISIVDPSGHVEEPIFSPPPSTEPSTPYVKHAPKETRFRFRHRTRMILNVLFPSLQSFRHKSIIGMILSVFSVPAILVLTLTLPVVDDGAREGGIALPESDQEPLAADLEPGQLVEEDYGDGLLRPDIGEGLHHLVDGGFSPLHSPLGRIHLTSRRTPEEEEYDEEDDDDGERGQELMEALEREESFGFNKSLTAAQCVFGPTFCAYIIFGEMEYVWYILLACAVIGSIAAIVVTYEATDGSQTTWRMVRCFGGFICSMVWIAAIADEVVSVLQSIGELMGLSDAIIGLTIFAIGNSMADLVANITVAQFAPAMAYAACFGGPMLNLLLGVGGSGTYHLLFHPNKPVELHFSPTLWVSATGLIVILLATAIVVPLNGYLIDRRWASVLMVAYGGLMIANIVVEIKTGRA